MLQVFKLGLEIHLSWRIAVQTHHISFYNKCQRLLDQLASQGHTDFKGDVA